MVIFKDIKDQLHFSVILGEMYLIWNLKGNVLIGSKLYQENLKNFEQIIEAQ